MEENETSLLNTKIDDMTVGDSLKLQLYILAGMAGVASVVGLGGVVAEKVDAWRRKRKLQKLQKKETQSEND